MITSVLEQICAKFSANGLLPKTQALLMVRFGRKKKRRDSRKNLASHALSLILGGSAQHVHQIASAFHRSYGALTRNTSQAQRPTCASCVSLTFALYLNLLPYWSVLF